MFARAVPGLPTAGEIAGWHSQIERLDQDSPASMSDHLPAHNDAYVETAKRKLEECDVAGTHISKDPKSNHTGRKSVEMAPNVTESKFWIMSEELQDIIGAYLSCSAIQVSRAALIDKKLPPCAPVQVAHGLSERRPGIVGPRMVEAADFFSRAFSRDVVFRVDMYSLEWLKVRFMGQTLKTS